MSETYSLASSSLLRNASKAFLFNALRDLVHEHDCSTSDCHSTYTSFVDSGHGSSSHTRLSTGTPYTTSIYYGVVLSPHAPVTQEDILASTARLLLHRQQEIAHLTQSFESRKECEAERKLSRARIAAAEANQRTGRALVQTDSNCLIRSIAVGNNYPGHGSRNPTHLNSASRLSFLDAYLKLTENSSIRGPFSRLFIGSDIARALFSPDRVMLDANDQHLLSPAYTESSRIAIRERRFRLEFFYHSDCVPDLLAMVELLKRGHVLWTEIVCTSNQLVQIAAPPLPLSLLPSASEAIPSGGTFGGPGTSYSTDPSALRMDNVSPMDSELPTENFLPDIDSPIISTPLFPGFPHSSPASHAQQQWLAQDASVQQASTSTPLQCAELTAFLLHTVFVPCMEYDHRGNAHLSCYEVITLSRKLIPFPADLVVAPDNPEQHPGVTMLARRVKCRILYSCLDSRAGANSASGSDSSPSPSSLHQHSPPGYAYGTGTGDASDSTGTCEDG